MHKWGSYFVPVPLSDKFFDDDLTADFRGTYFISPVCLRLARTGRNDGSACEIFTEYKIGDNWEIAKGYIFQWTQALPSWSIPQK